MKNHLLQLSIALAVCSSSIGFVHAQENRQSGPRGKKLFQNASIDRAWQQSIANEKPLLVMFTSDNCLYCQKMLTQTYGHPAIERLLTREVESVLAHADDYGDLIERMGIRGFPTSLLISPKGQVLEVFEGFVEPKKFAERIVPILADNGNQLSNNSSR